MACHYLRYMLPVQSARAHLVKLSKWLRDRDKEAGCNNCAIADLLFLYAHTINWFQAIRDYKASPRSK